MTLLVLICCLRPPPQPKIGQDWTCRTVRRCGPGATLEACADPAEEAPGTLVWYRIRLEADGDTDFSQMLSWADGLSGCASLRAR